MSEASIEFVKTRLEALQKSDGIFGDGFVESIDFNESKDKALHFLSEVNFATVHVQNNGTRMDFPVVVKVRIKNSFFQVSFTRDVFVNESAMYKELLPELNDNRQSNLVAKCYYSSPVHSQEPIIVLEDLRSRGYKVVKDDLFLDASHMKLSLEKLGQFHGLGYKYKQKHNDIREKCRELKKLKFTPEWSQTMDGVMSYYLNRYVDKLIKGGEHKEIMMNFSGKLKDFKTFFDSVTAVEEPFATVVHGDFNKNNIIFLYNTEDQPVDVKFFDLQNSVYGDPSLDLAFFIYMNTDQSSRDNHWSDFMSAYWTGLTSVAPEPGFSFEECLEHFISRAVVGYVEPAFYIPTCLDPEGAMRLQMDNSLSDEEKMLRLEALGGEKAYEIVTSVLLDLIDRGCIEKFLGKNDK